MDAQPHSQALGRLAWPDDLRKALERGLFCPLKLEDPDDIPPLGDIKEKYVPYIKMLRASQNPWHQEALLEEMPELEAPAPPKGATRVPALRTASCPLSSGQ